MANGAGGCARSDWERSVRAKAVSLAGDMGGHRGRGLSRSDNGY